MTPLDIKKQTFPLKWRGYDPAQVQAFLEAVAGEFDQWMRQSAQLQSRLNESEERVYQYRLIEKTLQDTALTLQQTLEEKRKTAEQEAGLIVQQAHRKADEESQALREKAGELRADITTLENQRRQLFIRLKNLLEEQTQSLETLRRTDSTPS